MDSTFWDEMCKYKGPYSWNWQLVTATDKKIREYLAKEASFLVLSRLSWVQECQSPIEQLLGLAMFQRLWADGLMTGLYKCNISKQAPIKTRCGNYRADFLVEGTTGDTPIKLVVECDGHEFHEKTKKQAARDKIRDRAMQAAGYTIMRFTGSEIWAKPDDCAAEISEMFLRLAKDPEQLDIDAMTLETPDK